MRRAILAAVARRRRRISGGTLVEPFADLTRTFGGIDPMIDWYADGLGGFGSWSGCAPTTVVGSGAAPSNDASHPFTDGISKATKFNAGSYLACSSFDFASTDRQLLITLLCTTDMSSAAKMRYFGNFGSSTPVGVDCDSYISAGNGSRVGAKAYEALGGNFYTRNNFNASDGWHMFVWAIDAVASIAADKVVCCIDSVDATQSLSTGADASFAGSDSKFCIGGQHDRHASTACTGSVGLFMAHSAADLGLPQGGGNAAHVESWAADRYAELPL